MNIDNEIIAYPVHGAVSMTRGLKENDSNLRVHGMNNDNKRIDHLSVQSAVRTTGWIAVKDSNSGVCLT